MASVTRKKYFRELTSRDSAELWMYLLEEAAAAGTLVLVNNLLMEREVRRKWQWGRKGFAPDIRTLESWLEELALHSLSDDELPGLLLNDEERTLWLEQWLSNHKDPDFRRFAGAKSVTAISNIIGSLYREGHRPGALFGHLQKNAYDSEFSDPGRRFVLAEILVAYEMKMEEMNWLDREQLIGKMTLLADGVIRYDKVVLFLPDELDALQVKALQTVSNGVGSPEMVAIRFDVCVDRKADSHLVDESDSHREEGADKSIVAKATDGICRSDATEVASRTNITNGPVYLDQFHHPREELEAAVRHILALMVKQNGNESNNPDTRSDQIGTRFDDYIILTGDLSLYEPMVTSVAKRFDIPLYTSRGMSLISHPFIRRLLTYLKLEQNGFQIDDIFHVFADNRIVLPDLEDHDEQKPPNIRHFSQFCRTYNFRTLEEVSAGMDRVFDWLLNQIHFEDDGALEQKRKEALRRDHEFYCAVVRHLEVLRKRFMTPNRQNLSDWVNWSDSLLELQKNLMSREANEVRELLVVILEKLAGAQAKLGLKQKMTRYDFFKLLELRLKETREQPQDRPGGVLLTEIHQLTDVHDKTVFVLGLHEDGFPRADRPDFLQFRYESALQAITGRVGTESYDIGRMQLCRLLASKYPRFLSRPALVEQKKVIPSPLWLDLEEQMRHDFKHSGKSGKSGRSGKSCNSEKSEKSAINDHSASFRDPEALQNIVTSPIGKLVDGWPDDRVNWLMSDYDVGIGAVSGLLRINDISLSSGFNNVFRRFQLASEVEQERQDPGSMGQYDGMVDTEIMKQWWAQHSADGRMAMSISRLDTFASSPQEYFYKYVLRLQPLHEYQDDADSNIKGSLLHRILQDFYSETAEEGPPVRPADDSEAAQKRMKAIRMRLVESYRHQLGNPDSPFPDILMKNLEKVTRWFVEMESDGYPDFTEGLDDARPAVFYPGSEFTMEHRWEFEKTLDGLKVDFRGIIDRIDLTSDGKSGVILDYKSGRSGAKRYRDIVDGSSFQLPVYGMFVRNKNISFYLSGYYQLPVNGKRKDVGIAFALGSAELIREQNLNKKSGQRKINMVQYKPTEEMDAFLTAIEVRRIAWIVRAIREGSFHVSLTGDSKWSDFRFIKRYDERIQHIRSNREHTIRNDKGMVFELDRYYLAEPFWEDSNE